MFLGIDTSAYTTSLALITAEGRILADSRIQLPVPTGQQGLQQSTALFLHLGNLPGMLDEIFQKVGRTDILTVAASTKPRPLPESYMPVFLAGRSMAAGIAAALKVPLIETSHQEGHLAAGLWSAQKEGLKPFLAIHLSGGTSELLLVEKRSSQPLEFSIRILGSTLDISAGQFIDRVGVAMGLPFPAGSALENKAREYFGAGNNAVIGNSPASEIKLNDKVSISSAVKGLNMSFSGGETQAKELLKQGVPHAMVSRAVEHCIAMTIEKVLRKAIEDIGIKEVLIVGGVATNNYIRNRLIKRLEHRAIGAKLTYAAREYCSDNAVGVAIIAGSALGTNSSNA